MYRLPPEATEAEFRELLSYWDSKSPNGLLPGRQHIDPTELPPRHLSRLLLLDVVEGATGHGSAMPRRFRFRVAGTAFTNMIGRDVTGRFYDEVAERDRLAPILSALNLIVEHRAPVFLIGGLVVAAPGYVRVKRLGLPLAQDGRTVDMILATWHAEHRSDPDATVPREPGAPTVLERG